MDISSSTDKYESWLAAELGSEILKKDLKKKRKEMVAGPFPFLRATYWRWAEMMPSLCQKLDLGTAPHALAVGDIHLENFGTWRDEDGRLVWGVNDYDEAAEMPYLLDLVRLATSAAIARGDDHRDIAAVTEPLLDGYAKGLEKPRPCILDGEPDEGSGIRPWLRQQAVVPEPERKAFWDKLERKRQKYAEDPDAPAPPSRYKKVLLASLPPGSEEPEIWHRRAGLGSLGRPRWVARAVWRGGLVVREAKAVIPSAWTRVDAGGDRTSRSVRCMEIATGRYRAPDPWYRAADGIAVRRLSPNNRKLEAASGTSAVEEDSEAGRGLGLDILLDPRMLKAMGRELASIHLGTGENDYVIAEDLKDRGRDGSWLKHASTAAADAVWKEWCNFKNSTAE